MTTITNANSDHSIEHLATCVINSTNEAIIVIDENYCIMLMNQAAQAMIGLSASQGSNNDIRNLLKQQQSIIYVVDIAMHEGRSISDRETIQLLRPHSSALPIQTSASPLYADNGTQLGVILSLHDASNIKQLEQDVQRTERLGMLDTLAAGLAHEVKNPLSGIRGAAQLLSMELEQRPELREYTQIMIKETDRINGIIEELMDLSTPRTKELTQVNLTQIINDIILLQAQSKNGQKIQFNMQLDPSIPPIVGDQTLLTRLFLNVIKNACEAVKTDGNITVSTRIDTEHHLSTQGHTPVPFVVVKIIDDGAGIPPALLHTIFTPFFTTKSNGTGLGLAISQKIINDHDGMLQIESTPEQGTCCSIYLPFRRTLVAQ
ncbi:MAG: ATP-binding protein [Desulfuromonas sp.]|nr:ATP-binding protein [Desulfuromonas sp.]